MRRRQMICREKQVKKIHDMQTSLDEDVLAHLWSCGDSFLEIWWLIFGVVVVTPVWRFGGSSLEMNTEQIS